MIDLRLLPDRMKVWFTPQMIVPDDVLLRELEGIASQYDVLGESITRGTFDSLMAESDKLQAELWRRYVKQVLEQD